MALVLVGPLNNFAVGAPPIDVSGPFQQTNSAATERMLYRLPDSPQGAPQLSCLSLRCTHQFCSLVDWGNILPDTTIIQCTCHNSEFNLMTGAVVQSPATFPLTRFAVQVNGGNVFVDSDPMP